jgi:hypothetical protein
LMLLAPGVRVSIGSRIGNGPITGAMLSVGSGGRLTQTQITGLVKGTGTGYLSAVAGVDYLPPNGDGSSLIDLNASQLTHGVTPTPALGLGTASANTFLRGDQTWAPLSSIVAPPLVFTPGSIPFAGSPSGDLTEDNVSLFWDESNKILRVPQVVGGTASGGALTLQTTTNATLGPLNVNATTIDMNAAGRIVLRANVGPSLELRCGVGGDSPALYYYDSAGNVNGSLFVYQNDIYLGTMVTGSLVRIRAENTEVMTIGKVGLSLLVPFSGTLNVDVVNALGQTWLNMTSGNGANSYASYKLQQYTVEIDCTYNYTIIPGSGGPGGVNIGDNPGVYATPNRLRVKTGGTAQGGIGIEGVASQVAPLVSLKGISSTSTGRPMGTIDVKWISSTDATRTGLLTLGAEDFSGTTRIGIGIGSDGTQVLTGFFDKATTPIAKPSGDVSAALAALGLVTSPTISGGVLAVGVTSVTGSLINGGHLYVDSTGKLNMDVLGFNWNPTNKRMGLGAAPFNALLDITHDSTLSTKCLQLSNKTTSNYTDIWINTGTNLQMRFGSDPGAGYFYTATAYPVYIGANNRERIYCTSAGPTWIGDAATGTPIVPVGMLEVNAMSVSTIGLVVSGQSGQTSPLFQLWGVSSTAAKRAMATINSTWIVNTDATRTGRLTLAAEDYTGTTREGFRVSSDGTQALISFFAATAVAKQPATGSRAGNAALASVITLLATMGLLTDGTTA